MVASPVTAVLQATAGGWCRRIAVFLSNETGRKQPVDGVIIVKGQPELLEVVSAFQGTGP